MSGFIYVILSAIVLVFHKKMSAAMRKDNVKTIFCAIWSMDAILSIGGVIISFGLYEYEIRPLLTIYNLGWIILYLGLTVLLISATPSGFMVLQKKKEMSTKERMLAEYRLNDTLVIVRDCFWWLLLVVFFTYEGFQMSGREELHLLFSLNGKIRGGFCMIVFLILVPISIRQMIFWVHNLSEMETTEEELEKAHYMTLHYRRKNRGI